jgi:hypothetical protein
MFLYQYFQKFLFWYSTVLWNYNIVFHYLGHALQCFMWKFLDFGSAWKYEFYHKPSLILVTRHAYKNSVKSPIRNSFYLQMRTTQGPLWHSFLVQTSPWELEWCVSVHIRENCKFWICVVQVCKPSLIFSLFPQPSEVYGWNLWF